MLRQLLRRKFALLPQSAQTDACRRLGSWYERTGEYLTAAEFFRQAGDWDGLLRTAAADCGKSIGGEHRQMLLSWPGGRAAAAPGRGVCADAQAVLLP